MQTFAGHLGAVIAGLALTAGSVLAQAPASTVGTAATAARCRRKFLHYFPGGFRDETYFDWERGYKQKAHERWGEQLHPDHHDPRSTTADRDARTISSAGG